MNKIVDAGMNGRVKRFLLLVAGIVLLAATAITFASGAEDTGAAAGTESAVVADSVECLDTDRPREQVIVYYFHGNLRCPTCKKLEEYSAVALNENFKSQLDDSAIVWRVVNFEDEGNDHYVEDYKLVSQSLLLSRVVGGKEAEWKNLDKIWLLVGDKEDYLAYVIDETRSFLESSSK